MSQRGTTNAPWRGLKQLGARALDLDRIAVLRDAPRARLEERDALEALLCELGLNDEHLDEFPPALRASCGKGLLLWQFPCQFAPYLQCLSRLGIASYLEIGIRHGGSFIATVEYLSRFHAIDRAIGIDIIPCPTIARYRERQPAAEHWCLNSRSPELAAKLDALGRIDLVFIDSHHEEAQCRDEVALIAAHADAIALHDISNVGCPGVGKVWRELASDPAYAAIELTEQYDARGPFMGIGLALRRARWPEVA